MNEIINFILDSIEYILQNYKNYSIKECLKIITYLMCNKLSSRKFNINLNDDYIKYIYYKMNKIKFTQIKINKLVPIYKKILLDYNNYSYEFYYN